MQHTGIVTRLSSRCSQEVVYAITMDTILMAIVQRLGEEALTLTTEELNLAREEVRIAIDHNLDERDYIDMGLDAWREIYHLI